MTHLLTCIISHPPSPVWPCSGVRCNGDLWLDGRGIYLRLLRCQLTISGKLFTHHKQSNWTPVAGQQCFKAGKVIVGLTGVLLACVTLQV